MFNIKKINNVLKNQNGATIVIVLATTMFLIILCSSALIAASHNFHSGLAFVDYNKKVLFAKSVQNVVKSSMFDVVALEGDGTFVLEKDTPLSTLGGKIIHNTYFNTDTVSMALPNTDGNLGFDAEYMNPSLDINLISKSYFVDNLGTEIAASNGLTSEVLIKTDFYVSMQPGKDDVVTTTGSGTNVTTPGLKDRVSIPSGTIEVYVTVEGGDGINITTKATYSVANVKLSGDVIGVTPTKMLIEDPGEWRFISIDNVEYKNIN